MGKLPPQGIVDHLFPRCPRAVGGLVDEPGDVGVKGQGSTHTGIIVPPDLGIKMRTGFMTPASARLVSGRSSGMRLPSVPVAGTLLSCQAAGSRGRGA